MAFWNLEPWGFGIEDMQWAEFKSLFASANSKRNFTPDNFMHKTENVNNEKTPEEIAEFMKRFAKVQNARAKEK